MIQMECWSVCDTKKGRPLEGKGEREWKKFGSTKNIVQKVAHSVSVSNWVWKIPYPILYARKNLYPIPTGIPILTWK